MVTMAATETDYVEALNSALLLEYNALEAYDVAIERLDHEELVTQMRRFREDHIRHIEDLTSIVRGHGHEPHKSTGAKSMITAGKVALADLAGDKAILRAMKTNEDDTVTAYERLLGHERSLPEAAEAVRRGHEDELRHRAWMEDAAARL
ncbi:MAG: DUF892 family protein [Rhodothalassiaceae bacterium]